jgi:hypothetical protein
MIFSKKTSHLLLFVCCCFLILPNNLFAASELNSTSSTSSASSSTATGVPEGGAGGGGGGHGKAKSGTMLGGVLIAVGTVGLGISIAGCSSCVGMCGWCYKIPLDVLAIAGGIMAMNQNSKAASDTAPKGINFGGITAGGLNSGIPNIPDGVPNVNIAEKCREAPSTCSCNDAACSQPQLTLPPKEELEKLIRNGPIPDGSSLEDALAKLNENYDKAREGVGKFNQLSSAGAFDPAGSGLAGLGDGDGSGDSSENGNSDSTGLGAGSSGKRSSSSDDSYDDDFKTEPMIDALAKQRGEQGKVLLMGMNAIDKKGKALSIFERLTRALRGKNDRDLVLAKNEWIRKKALKNKKNSVKLNMNALQKK